jgi:hypothetical protein
MFSCQCFVRISHLYHARYTPHASDSPWLEYSTTSNIWQGRKYSQYPDLKGNILPKGEKQSLLLLLLLLLWLYIPFLGLGRFFSFLILYRVGMTPWTGDQPVLQGLYLHTEQTDIQALSGIRTYDLSVRASEDGSWIRPRSHCDRHKVSNTPTKYFSPDVFLVGVCDHNAVCVCVCVPRY